MSRPIPLTEDTAATVSKKTIEQARAQRLQQLTKKNGTKTNKQK